MNGECHQQQANQEDTVALQHKSCFVGETAELDLNPDNSNNLITTRNCFYDYSTETFRLFGNEFKQVGIIASGRFGRVLFVEHREVGTNRQCYALKAMQKLKIVQKAQVQHVKQERQILSTVDHPFIVKLIAAFTDNHNCYILMELVSGGDIFSILNNLNNFDEIRASFYTVQICSALEYLHERYIAYRDLKPENTLIGLDGYVKLGDFGFARHCFNGDKMFTICGTVAYGAPEILTKCGYGLSVDWWALGVLIYEMCDGSLPFNTNDAFTTQQHVTKTPLTIPENFSDELTDLLKLLIHKDANVRYQHGSNTISGGIINHPWLSKWNIDAIILKQYYHKWQPIEDIEGMLDRDVFYYKNNTIENGNTFDEEFQDFSD